MRGLARLVRTFTRRLKIEAWTLRVKLAARRSGGRVEVHFERGAYFDAGPVIRFAPRGSGNARTRIAVGCDTVLRRDLEVEVWALADNSLELGEEVVIGSDVHLELRGGTVRVGARSTIRSGTVLKSDGTLSLGTDVLVSYACTLHCTERIRIGDHAVLAELVGVTDSDHQLDGSATPLMQQPLSITPTEIEGNVLVSRCATILRGSHVGRDSLIAAGSVVRRGDYPPHSLLAGAPARRIGDLRESPTQEP